jgi:hypothetical protein
MSTPSNRKKSQPNVKDDFVSDEVNHALQEARQIITNKGKAKPDEHLIEESTTVKIKNFGKKATDPVEVFISRSTKKTQDSSDEEDNEITGKLFVTLLLKLVSKFQHRTATLKSGLLARTRLDQTICESDRKARRTFTSLQWKRATSRSLITPMPDIEGSKMVSH